MNYIIFDLEWNQSSEGKEKENKDLPFEIIEIGAVKLNSKKKKVADYSRLIKPQVYKTMHHITKKLIHIKMDELQSEQVFVEVMRNFFDWCGDDIVFCTWGPLDLMELQRNMRFYHMQPLSDGPIPFLDVQKLFSLEYEGGVTRRALESAVDFINLEKDIPFHRAYSDAYYTAKILASFENKEVEQKISYDVFSLPKDKKAEVHATFDTYQKYISREFKDKAEALHDKDVLETKCYKCHTNLRKKIRWFSLNGKHYYSVSYCNVHGFMKGKIRIRKAEGGGIYVVKTLKLITEEEAEKLRQKQERAKKMKYQHNISDK